MMLNHINPPAQAEELSRSLATVRLFVLSERRISLPQTPIREK